MMTKEGSTKIVNFITPGAGVVLGHGHISLKIFSNPGHRSDKLSLCNADQETAYQHCKFYDHQGRGGGLMMLPKLFFA